MQSIGFPLPRGQKLCVTAASTIAVTVIAATGLLTSQAAAAFSLYEDFQDVALGSDLFNDNAGENFVGGITLTNNSGEFTVIADPALPGNRLLQSTAAGKAVTGAVNGSVANNTSATLFYRIYRLGLGTAPDINFGLADDANPPSTTVVGGPYESQLNVSGGVGTGQNSEFSPRDGGGTANTDVIFTPNTYYGIFQVIDNTNDATQFYYQRPTDPAPILLTGGTPPYTFRNGTAANPLINFLLLAGISTPGTQDTFYLDDIYLDTTGANLTSPVPITGVPEPSAGCLAVVGCLSVIGARRARRTA